MNTSLLILFSLFVGSESSGFLRLHLTADSDCLVHLEHSPFYSETVRLLAYETRTLDVYSQSAQSHLPVSLQLLHHFSGKSLSDMSIQEFQTQNNGRSVSRVVDSEAVILSIRSTFFCEKGYFGPLCERRSLPLPDTLPTVSTVSPQVSFDFAISDETVLYCSIAFFVLLLIVAQFVLYYCRSRPVHVFQDTLPVDVSRVFTIDESSLFSKLNESESRYYDVPSRFYSSATLESMV